MVGTSHGLFRSPLHSGRHLLHGVSPVLFELDRPDEVQGRSNPRLLGRNRQIVPAFGHEDMEKPLAAGPIAVLLSLLLHPLLAHANALNAQFPPAKCPLALALSFHPE